MHHLFQRRIFEIQADSLPHQSHGLNGLWRFPLAVATGEDHRLGTFALLLLLARQLGGRGGRPLALLAGLPALGRLIGLPAILVLQQRTACQQQGAGHYG